MRNKAEGVVLKLRTTQIDYTDSLATLPIRDGNHSAGNYRASQGGSEKVYILINDR